MKEIANYFGLTEEVTLEGYKGTIDDFYADRNLTCGDKDLLSNLLSNKIKGYRDKDNIMFKIDDDIYLISNIEDNYVDYSYRFTPHVFYSCIEIKKNNKSLGKFIYLSYWNGSSRPSKPINEELLEYLGFIN